MASIVERIAFSVTVISSGYAAAWDLCKHNLVLGANPGTVQQVALSQWEDQQLKPHEQNMPNDSGKGYDCERGGEA